MTDDDDRNEVCLIRSMRECILATRHACIWVLQQGQTAVYKAETVQHFDITSRTGGALAWLLTTCLTGMIFQNSILRRGIPDPVSVPHSHVLPWGHVAVRTCEAVKEHVAAVGVVLLFMGARATWFNAVESAFST